MMVDEDVVYLCPSMVYRILDRHGLLYRWKRPEPGKTAISIPGTNLGARHRGGLYHFGTIDLSEND
jgi:hypothetical protein